jgi:DUF2946 family protein
MIFHAHKRLTAWLGMFAMCLIVCVPLVSQLVMAAHADEPNAVFCSALQTDAQGAHHMSADPLTACGYCDLLSDHVAVPAVPLLLPVLIVLLVAVAAAVLSTRFTPLGAFPSGRPRAPPFLSLSSL